ncbi:MAG: helix-turn-helix domain-containing protein [Candidatus Sungbacteria bacterium]|nr:helix-turn-helix domain-containing protein [Candidatus Sungbacteria bacterium]
MAFGEILREAREEIGRSAKEVADKLQIPLKIVDALEREDFSKLPPRVYTRGFLKKYALHLGLPEHEVLSEFDLQGSDGRPGEAKRPSRAERGLGIQAFFDRIRGVSLFSLAILLAVGAYFFFGFRHIWGGPDLVVKLPEKDISIDQEKVRISGSAGAGANVFLNGRALAVNEEGKFDETALLRKGLNALEFEAVDRLGKAEKRVRYVFVK